MNSLDNELYWEMVRTIKLLGGKEDILGALGMMESSMPQREAEEETYRMVRCWNDKVEEKLNKIPESPVYQVVHKFPCKEHIV